MNTETCRAVMAIVGLSRDELEQLTDSLVKHFPERAAELEFFMWSTKTDSNLPVDL